MLNLKHIAQTSASEILCCDECPMIDVECGRIETKLTEQKVPTVDAMGFVTHAQRMGSATDE